MTHEELVEAVCAHTCRLYGFVGEYEVSRAMNHTRSILALIAERLKEPTEEMLAAAFAAARYGEDMKIHRDVTQKQYCAMLVASPLAPSRV